MSNEYIEQSNEVRELSIAMNKLMTDFEKENNTKLLVCIHGFIGNTELYPLQSKLQLIEIY